MLKKGKGLDLVKVGRPKEGCRGQWGVQGGGIPDNCPVAY